jgi:hypothetical protein
MSKTVDFASFRDLVVSMQAIALDDMMGGKAPFGKIIEHVCMMASAFGSDAARDLASKKLSERDHRIIALEAALAEADKKAEAGMCQFSADGKHAFLSDIRKIAATAGVQGGIHPGGALMMLAGNV